MANKMNIAELLDAQARRAEAEAEAAAKQAELDALRGEVIVREWLLDEKPTARRKIAEAYARKGWAWGVVTVGEFLDAMKPAQDLRMPAAMAVLEARPEWVLAENAGEIRAPHFIDRNGQPIGLLEAKEDLEAGILAKKKLALELGAKDDLVHVWGTPEERAAIEACQNWLNATLPSADRARMAGIGVGGKVETLTAEEFAEREAAKAEAKARGEEVTDEKEDVNYEREFVLACFSTNTGLINEYLRSNPAAEAKGAKEAFRERDFDRSIRFSAERNMEIEEAHKIREEMASSWTEEDFNLYYMGLKADFMSRANAKRHSCAVEQDDLISEDSQGLPRLPKWEEIVKVFNDCDYSWRWKLSAYVAPLIKAGYLVSPMDCEAGSAEQEEAFKKIRELVNPGYATKNLVGELTGETPEENKKFYEEEFEPLKNLDFWEAILEELKFCGKVSDKQGKEIKRLPYALAPTYKCGKDLDRHDTERFEEDEEGNARRVYNTLCSITIETINKTSLIPVTFKVASPLAALILLSWDKAISFETANWMSRTAGNSNADNMIIWKSSEWRLRNRKGRDPRESLDTASATLLEHQRLWFTSKEHKKEREAAVYGLAKLMVFGPVDGKGRRYLYNAPIYRETQMRLAETDDAHLVWSGSKRLYSMINSLGYNPETSAGWNLWGKAMMELRTEIQKAMSNGKLSESYCEEIEGRLAAKRQKEQLEDSIKGSENTEDETVASEAAPSAKIEAKPESKAEAPKDLDIESLRGKSAEDIWALLDD